MTHFHSDRRKYNSSFPLKTSCFNENDLPLVLRITYGNTSFLLLADAELAAEADIMAASREKRYDIQSTLIKVGHHGRHTSTSIALLQEVKPEYAVISTGDQNTYEHPSPDTLDRLRMANVSVYRTDMEGHIVCLSNGETLIFIAEKDKEETQ